MLTVFWDIKRSIIIDFLEKVAIVNSLSYCKLPKQKFTFLLNETRILNFILNPSNMSGDPCNVMVKTMDWGIVVSVFELQPRYYVLSRINTLGKGMNPLILPVMG